jgi:hypothetical protein
MSSSSSFYSFSKKKKKKEIYVNIKWPIQQISLPASSACEGKIGLLYTVAAAIKTLNGTNWVTSKKGYTGSSAGGGTYDATRHVMQHTLMPARSATWWSHSATELCIAVDPWRRAASPGGQKQ